MADHDRRTQFCGYGRRQLLCCQPTSVQRFEKLMAISKGGDGALRV